MASGDGIRAQSEWGHMGIHNRYAAAYGESHFRGIEIAWVENTTAMCPLTKGLEPMLHSLVPIE